MSARLRRPVVSFAAAVAVLAVAVGAAEAARPEGTSPATPAAREAPVSVATLVCPDVRAAPGAEARVVAASPPVAPGAGAVAGQAQVLAGLGADAGRRASVPGPGAAAAATATSAGPYAVRATGSVAPGLTALTTTRAAAGDLRGLDSAACVRPGTDFWFVGAGAVVGQRDVLRLTNAEPTPAEVDVDLFGVAGAITAPSAQGLTVPPGGVLELRLDALAPGVAAVAAHVVARSGRVAAALRDVQVEGLAARGVDHLPPAVSPRSRVVVPGVPGGAGPRVLHIATPGERDALVGVRLLAGRGGSPPAGPEVITARAGAVTTVDLAEYTGGEAVAVQLDSDVPITASVLARTGATGATGTGEIAWTAAARPHAGAALLADSGAATGVTSTLALSTIGPASRVSLEPVAVGTGLVPAAFEVAVPADGTVAVALPEAAGPYAVRIVPAPDSGPLWIARVLTAAASGGPFVTVAPVEPAVSTVVVPEVVADVSVGVRGSSSSSSSSSS